MNPKTDTNEDKKINLELGSPTMHGPMIEVEKLLQVSDLDNPSNRGTSTFQNRNE